MNLPLIRNEAARRLFLDRHALAEPPAGDAQGARLATLIDRLGFVQVDSIATVERAHHMILRARRPSYRPAALAPLLERDRHLWEHWTHDASILPVDLFPHWRHRFDHNRARLVERWTGWQRPGFETKFDEVLRRVADHGPVSAAEVGEGEERGKGGWWDWHPSKAALEYLWLVGELSVTRRENFRKIYDLTERVIPAAHRRPGPDRAETVDWACRGALDPEEAREWCRAAQDRGEVIEAEVEGWNGARRRVVLWPGTPAEIPPEPTGRLRVLSPFDPALRDRKRAEFLFGFFYRIEIYVPEPRRQYGYYVFPVLEGDRLVGRLDAKAHRDEGVLRVRGFWPEAGIRLGTGRRARLEAELDRLARFAGCDRVAFLPGWERETLRPAAD
jgi:uncharacterized protein YcaQ